MQNTQNIIKYSCTVSTDTGGNMLLSFAGVASLIIAAILAMNGINDQRGRNMAEAGPTPEEFWDNYNQQYGPGADGPRMTGPRRPDEYHPEGFFAGAAILGLAGIIMLAIGLN